MPPQSKAAPRQSAGRVPEGVGMSRIKIPPALLITSLLALCQQPVRGQEMAPAPATSSPDGKPASAPVVAAEPYAPPAVPSFALTPPGPGPEGDFAAGSAASARGPFSIFSSADVGHLPYRVDYRATWFPDEAVKGQPTNLGLVREDLTLSCPVWQCAPDEWSLSAHLRNELFHTGAVFPQSGQPFPDELWSLNFGTTYRHLFDNGWVAGGTVSVGSASDQPFHSINEMTAGVNAFLRVPQGERNAWLFTLSYSSSSELPFPIPGVAFLWQPCDQLRMNIGLPFQVMYRPTEDWTFDLSYMLLTSVHARATYRAARMLRVYAGYDFDNESYLPVDRPAEEDRLFYYDQRVTLGAQFLISRSATLDLSSGYVFDRFYFEGRSLHDQGHNRIDVGSGTFLSADCRIRW